MINDQQPPQGRGEILTIHIKPLISGKIQKVRLDFIMKYKDEPQKLRNQDKPLPKFTANFTISSVKHGGGRLTNFYWWCNS